MISKLRHYQKELKGNDIYKRAADMLKADDRKPLTVQQIYKMHDERRLSTLTFARAIEAAHGICAQTMRMEDAP